MPELQGKVALITGAGSGIGKAAAAAFAREGARLVITDINLEAAQATAREIGTDCVAVPGDHRRRDDNARAVDAAMSKWGQLDILYNNAGVAYRNDIDSTDDDAIEYSLSVNISGPYRMTQTALPALRQRAKDGGFPAILFTASIHSLMVKPMLTLYGTSKHAVGGLVASMARELGPQGIRVNAVCPGPVDTPLLRKNLVAQFGDVETGMKTFAGDVPLGRIPTLTDVANAAIFLCSDKASIINGVLLPVDGGQTTG